MQFITPSEVISATIVYGRQASVPLLHECAATAMLTTQSNKEAVEVENITNGT